MKLYGFRDTVCHACGYEINTPPIYVNGWPFHPRCIERKP